MARKRDGLIELLTELPWWVSVVVAGVIYIGMRWILPSIEFQNLMLKSIAASTPKAAWFVALSLLIPGLVSIFERKQRQQLFDSRSDLDSIRKLSWSDFELLIGESFRRQGYAGTGGVGTGRTKASISTSQECVDFHTILTHFVGVFSPETDPRLYSLLHSKLGERRDQHGPARQDQAVALSRWNRHT